MEALEAKAEAPNENAGGGGLSSFFSSLDPVLAVTSGPFGAGSAVSADLGFGSLLGAPNEKPGVAAFFSSLEGSFGSAWGARLKGLMAATDPEASFFSSVSSTVASSSLSLKAVRSLSTLFLSLALSASSF